MSENRERPQSLVEAFGLGHIAMPESASKASAAAQGDFREQKAAWRIHIVLATGIATQAVPAEQAKMNRDLDRVKLLGDEIRGILGGDDGFYAPTVSALAAAMINRVIQPFHDHFDAQKTPGGHMIVAADEFIAHLKELQGDLRKFARLMAYIANRADVSEAKPLPGVPAAA